MSLCPKDVYQTEHDWRNGATFVHIKLSNGKMYAKVGTLARMFDVSATEMDKRISELQQTYSIDVFSWSDRVRLVNLADFNHALFDSTRRNDR